MIKFTDEFINEASCLYRLAEETSNLSLTYLDELEDKLVINRLKDIFRVSFSKSMNFLSNEYNRPDIISAMKNYLIGLSCLNGNLEVCTFLNSIDLD